jgi:hypothetical protein
MQCGFSLLHQFLHGQDAMNIDHLIEMSGYPHHLLVHVRAQRLGDLDVVTFDV